jgi:hypothetical protein
MSPAEWTTASGKEPGSPALAQHANSARPGNYENRQWANPCTTIEDRPASLININTHFDRWLESHQYVYKVG